MHPYRTAAERIKEQQPLLSRFDIGPWMFVGVLIGIVLCVVVDVFVCHGYQNGYSSRPLDSACH